jgi:dTDP-4-dehydrorhamnose 3,5-epimerase
MDKNAGGSMVEVETTSIPEVKIVRPKRIGDDRGFFSEWYNRAALSAQGVNVGFIQDNMALSSRKGTVRGLHFQAPPFAQAKLVGCVRGAVFDVAVDIRRGSPTFGRHIAVELSAANGWQLFIPAGFAHGYCTLEENSVLFYKVDAGYSPQHDAGVLWQDPDIGIAWPVTAEAAQLSKKDTTLPLLKDLPPIFSYDARGSV